MRLEPGCYEWNALGEPYGVFDVFFEGVNLMKAGRKVYMAHEEAGEVGYFLADARGLIMRHPLEHDASRVILRGRVEIRTKSGIPAREFAALL